VSPRLKQAQAQREQTVSVPNGEGLACPLSLRVSPLYRNDTIVNLSFELNLRAGRGAFLRRLNVLKRLRQAHPKRLGGFCTRSDSQDQTPLKGGVMGTEV
jgi:hypothetical protein